jgi:protein-S-isoprenylcysteine O-methyltransferase Ste14
MTTQRASRGRWRRGRAGRPKSRRRADAGQTVTEYLMILGFITSVIIVLTKWIVPAVARGVLGLLTHMVVFVSSM